MLVHERMSEMKGATMVDRLERLDEPKAAMGGVGGDGIRSALGTTDMVFWDVFLRETVQNSWDAKDPGYRNIDFRIDGKTLSSAESQALADAFLPNESGVLALDDFRAKLGLAASNAGDAPMMLIVTDIGTKGLAGPTNAEEVVEHGTPIDYREFVLNMGRDETREIGGGSYGFGKAVLYDASAVNMCVIYTQFYCDEGIQSRLVAIRLGSPFPRDGRNFTGRHWWGRMTGDNAVEPVEGPAARELAIAIGMPLMTPDQTGTSIAVLEPILVSGVPADYSDMSDGGVDVVGDELEPVATMQATVTGLMESAVKWIWPHMIDDGEGPPITFSFSVDARPVPITDIEEHEVYRHYVRAYRAAETGLVTQQDGGDWNLPHKAIRSDRPKAYLGQLGFLSAKLPDSEDVLLAPTSHVALMRKPRLVVNYLPVPKDPTGMMRIGVFIADDAMNETFAKAEPAAHDDWRPTNLAQHLKGGARNPVKIALDRITKAFTAPVIVLDEQPASDPAPTGLAHVARVLGAALVGASGSGAEHKRNIPRKMKGPAVPKGIRVTLSDRPALGVDAHGVYADFGFTLTCSDDPLRAMHGLVATTTFVLDSGTPEKREKTALSEYPEVIGWTVDGILVANGDRVAVPEVDGQSLAVRVRQTAGRATTVKVDTHTVVALVANGEAA